MQRPPRSWLRLDSCGSTNDEAARLGREGAPEGTVVTARAQTGGRGRLGRRWHSPPDENLYLSLLLRPPFPPQRAPLLCLCAGLALHRAAQACLDEAAAPGEARLRLKWPNDLLGRLGPPAPGDGWRKLGGVLTELVCVGSRIDFVIVGVGCNVLGQLFPPELSATSLRLLAAGPDRPAALSVDRLAERLVDAIEDVYRRYLATGARPILDEFARAAGLGPDHEPITVALPGATLRGVPIGLGDDGELLVRTADGRVERVLSGDVALTAPPAPPGPVTPPAER